MILPAQFTLTAPRYAPFLAEIAVLSLEDLTGADFVMQVRDAWNGGTVRADLTTVADPADEGLALVSVLEADGVFTALISVRIDETTMEAMPALADEDSELVFDIQATPAGGDKQVYARGPFIVQAGSTQ